LNCISGSKYFDLFDLTEMINFESLDIILRLAGVDLVSPRKGFGITLVFYLLSPQGKYLMGAHQHA
jgi:hypothetical protein